MIHAVRSNDNKVYALKIFEDVAQFNEKYEEYVGLNHQNVCKILRLAVANGDNAKKHIVVQLMEYANRGDLKTFIQEHIDAKTGIPADTVRDFIIQIGNGLKYLHS